MRVVFVTNIVSAHQIGWTDLFSKFKDVSFLYLATRKEENNDIRYKTNNRDYVSFSHKLNDTILKNVINNADFLIIDDIEDERIRDLIRNKKNLILMSEHISKCNFDELFLLRGLRRYFSFYKKDRFKEIQLKDSYLLALSYYASKDFYKYGLKRSRCFNFGYHPIYEYISENQLSKKNNEACFVGRSFFKHREIAIKGINFLNDKSGKNIILNIIGEDGKSNNNIKYLGIMSHQSVIKKMQESSLFFFPSDRFEGWGVVLAEAMASGCIVFANKKAGSTNLLIDKNSGFTFSNFSGFKKSINKFLHMSNEEIFKMRINAINRIRNVYCPEIASERLHNFLHCLQNKNAFFPYKEGPLSIAKIK